VGGGPEGAGQLDPVQAGHELELDELGGMVVPGGTVPGGIVPGGMVPGGIVLGGMLGGIVPGGSVDVVELE
jgi:hypothetical protein